MESKYWVHHFELLIPATCWCPKTKATAFFYDEIDPCASADDNRNVSDVTLVRSVETRNFRIFKHIHTHRSSTLLHTCTCACTRSPGQFLCRSFPDAGAFLQAPERAPSTVALPNSCSCRWPPCCPVGDVGTREDNAFCDIFMWRQQSSGQLTEVNYSFTNGFCWIF